MIEVLQKLCSLPSPSGCEDAVRDYIRALAEPVADEIREDSIGNLMVFRKGKKSCGKTIMLAAHMDEVGIICKGYTEDGCVKFGFVGGVDPRVVIGRRVLFDDVRGVVGIKAVHLTTREERKTMPKTKDLYIDIGASDKKEAEKRVPLGTYGVFDSACVPFGDGLLKAKAIDDRVGCAVLLTLLLEQPAVDTWFVFSVQEEVGLRGARCAAFDLNPDICLVLEGTTAADLAEVDGAKQVCGLRRGVVIPFMDRATIYHQGMFETLRKLAEENGIPWQTKHRVAGGTDAGRIHLTRDGVVTGALAAPVRYIHSPSCVAAIDDMNGMLALSRRFLEYMGEDHHEI
ncbi:MAG: M42 family peptidase [Butyricicoccus porcorum]|nr:M42 family peptidase [Butyricicoccus porcorum]